MQLTLKRESKTPLYLQLKEQMRQRIVAGEWKPGQRLAGRKEMAEQLGVSSITVVQAVDELIRDGLVFSLRGSGTYVAEAPVAVKEPAITTATQRMTAASTLNIGLVFEDSDESNFFHSTLRMSVFQALTRIGGITIKPLPMSSMAQLDHNGLDGLIIGALDFHSRIYLDRLRAEGVAFVVAGAAYSDRTLPCVAVDNTRGMRAALDHLIGLGHRQIALIALGLTNPDHQERYRAYQQTMNAANISVDSRLLLLRPSCEGSVYDEISEWLDGNLPPFTAIVASAYIEGMVASQLLTETGVRVPNQVSFVMFDAPPSAEFHTPPLTTVRQPIFQLGERVVEKLITAIRAGRMPEGTDVLPMEMVVRKSTAAVPEAVA